MTEDKKQANEKITKAGAVELQEDQLKDASGGAAPLDAAVKLWPVEPAIKFAPTEPAIKFSPGAFQPAIKFAP